MPCGGESATMSDSVLDGWALEGLTGIEPASLVWKTKALPLSYSPDIDGFPPLAQFYGMSAA
jgi:hypothetical protein